MSLTTKDFHRALNHSDWRQWSAGYWSSLQSITVGQVHFYRKTIAPRCRQCRNLPHHCRGSGGRICACGNPYINSAGPELPLATRLAHGIKSWDKPLTSRQKAKTLADPKLKNLL
jgi:hypothetical protein